MSTPSFRIGLFRCATLMLALFVSTGCEPPGSAPEMSGLGGDAGLAAVAEEALFCPIGPAFPSCYGQCGALVCSPIDPSACCHCDPGCVDRGDCCCDYPDYCPDEPPPPPSCEGHCGGAAPEGCWCDSYCSGYGDCCGDFEGTCVSACDGSVPATGTSEEIQAIAAGPAGEVYVVGWRTVIGSGLDVYDGFLRRVHPTTFATLWDVAIDNCFWDRVYDVTVSATGDVLVVGASRFGAYASTQPSLVIRRYSSAGVMRWQVSPNTWHAAEGRDIAIDPTDDSAVVTGLVRPVSSSNNMALLGRVDSAGAPVFMNAMTLATGYHLGEAVAVGADGRIALVATHRPSGGLDARTLVAGFGVTGALTWIKVHAWSGRNALATDVTIDGAGYVYSLASVFTASTSIAVGTVQRYAANGALLWTRTVDSGTSYRPVVAMVREPGGTLLIAGYGTGSARPWLTRFSTSGAAIFTETVSSAPPASEATDLVLVDGGADALVTAIYQDGSGWGGLIAPHTL